MNTLKILKLGRLPYRQSYNIQKYLQRARLEKRIVDHILITEHPPVYTLGIRKLAGESLKWTPEEIKAKLGADIEESFRGGDVTFFGPGTLMVYGLLNIKERKLSAYEYVDKLEDIMIDSLEEMNIKGCIGRIADKRGVWTTESRGSQLEAKSKIGAIGVGMSKWTTIHGFALNVNTDLKFFEPIIPCGLRGIETTTVAKELGLSSPSSDALVSRAVDLIIKAIPEHLGYDSVEVVSVPKLDIAAISTDPLDSHLPISVIKQLFASSPEVVDSLLRDKL